MHDLFGSILYKSLQRKVDITQVLKYPLIHVPLLSLSHVDGTTLSTPKAALLTWLEAKGAMATPGEIDAQIIDAASFLHKNFPANFGGVTEFLLRKIFKKGWKGDSFCF